MGKSTARAAAARSKQRQRHSSDEESEQAAAVSPASSAAAAAAASASPLERVSEQMAELLEHPSLFFAADAANAAQCMRSTKALYDLAKSTAPSFLQVEDSVPALVTHARAPQAPVAAAAKGKGKAAAAAATGTPFSSEQIFAQLSLHTTPLLKRMAAQMKVLRAHVAKEEQERAERQEQGEEEEEEQDEDAEMEGEEQEGEFAEEDGEDEEDEDGEEEDAEDDEEAEEAGEDDEEEDGDSAAPKSKGKSDGAYRGRGGVEEDAFFSLDDMEKFADQFEEDQSDIDLGGDDEEGMEEGEDDEEEIDDDDDEGDDDAMDIDALKRQAIRAKHDASLKPLSRPLRDQLKEVDLDEDVGEIDLKRGERYDDFFDPPAPELLKAAKKNAKGKKGAKGVAGGRSMESFYAEEDANIDTYQDEDYTDEFGGDFRKLAQAERSGLLGKSGGGEEDAEEEEGEEEAEAALAASKPVNDESKESDGAEAPLSNYEKSARKLASQIALLETKITQPREWAQLGEVSGKNRPVDALLHTNLEFEHAGKVAPVITQAYTEEIEAMIRRRIVEERFDDVVRKVEEAPAKVRQPGEGEEVSGEKSAIGLGEVYEQEAQATLAAASGRASASEEKVNAAHKELGELMGTLFHKLDALCNFHFTPRSIHADELSVRAHQQQPASVSAISLEDAMPGHVSSARATAPQEAYNVSAQAMVGATELASEEKKSMRRRVKAQKKKKADAQAAKEAAKIASMGAAAQGNAAEGILRKAISSKEMHAATTARNVIQAGGKGAGAASSKGGIGSGKKGTVTPHGQGTKYSSSGAFFGKMQGVVAAGAANKKQRTK